MLYDRATITIPAVKLQACVTGHSYWIRGDGTLQDCGARAISDAAIPSPDDPIDLSAYDTSQWSLFYGAQTGNVGGKIGIAELWPTQPVEVVGTIPPYVRDVASHWLVTAGLSSPIQRSVPEYRSVLYDWTSLTATLLDSGIIPTEDFEFLTSEATASASTTTTVLYDIDEAGASYSLMTTGANTTQAVNYGIGSSINVGSGTASTAQAYVASVGPRTRLTWGAATGGTVRARVLGVRKFPLRRPRLIAPYLQWVNPGTGGAAPVVPTAASPIYIKLVAK